MNEYMRFRAGSLHPNPHVHAQWWSKFLTRHRHDIRTLESPVKKYMMKETMSIPKKLHSHSTIGTGTRPRSRPQSAATHRDASRGRPAHSRPQSAQMARPMSAGQFQRAPAAPAGQWEPFSDSGAQHAGRQMGPGTAHAHQTQVGMAAPTLRVSPSRSQAQHGRHSSDLVLRRVADAFLTALEDLDTVESDLMGNNRSMALKKRFAMLKIQVADLGKQVDLIRDELVANNGNSS